ncbi:MAG: hypothetical protein NTW21_11015 [Verrucomicrobia bacterium]|nr:hypothetical protein [Verrucomicrobiota bacterium]
MTPSPVEILRQQLREKFPQAHGVRAALEVAEVAEVAGQPITAETFPVGAISEVLPAGAGAGVLLLLAGLLGEPDEVSPHPELVVVDGADGFDPASYPGKACSRVLWVRCNAAMDMLKAADLLVRDGNVPLVLLDATGLARRDLAALPTSAWWRLKQATEHSGCRLVVLAPFPLVASASLRLTLSAELVLGDFDCPRHELLQRLRTVPQRLRQAT